MKENKENITNIKDSKKIFAFASTSAFCELTFNLDQIEAS